MPPKTRGRPIAPEAPQSEPDSVTSGDNASDHTDQGQNSDQGSDPDVSQSGVGPANFRFFNTTFSTFRLSPLYIGKNALTPAGLEMLSRRLRDTLVGDVMRGVQVGLESGTTLSRLGALERVEWRECSPETIFLPLADAEKRIGDEARQRHRNLQGRHRRGRAGGMQAKRKRHLLWLELEYEKTTFSALMLPPLDERNDKQSAHGVGGDDESSQLEALPRWTQGHANLERKDSDKTDTFAHFPLLLMRMPAPLKAVFVDFLSSTFDCRISPLHLGTRTLIHSLERWVEESGVGGGKLPNKDVALTLGFHLEPATDAKTMDSAPDEQHDPQKPILLGLKTIDIVVPAEESCRFLRVGKSATTNSTNTSGSNTRLGGRKRPAATTEREEERLRRRRLGGGEDQEGWIWRESPRQDQIQHQDQDDDNDELETFAQPFTNALSHYLNDHLALDMTQPGVRVLRVVCDAFALSETRMKIFAPRGQDDHAAGVAVNTFLRNLIRRAQGREWSDSALRLANLRLIA
ncbi:kinetochore complex Sim4 subunit Fta1-domain-containing protein [Xylaria digitata]|nr:kinetochore complex Sim4 subunit Fta1-domain-containing protein [Xylaria digitata]